MADYANVSTAGANEEEIERALRTLLGLLDRTVERVGRRGALCWLVACPLTVILLWQIWSWWAAILAGVVGTFALYVVITGAYEVVAVRRAARRFLSWFPAESPQRALALDVLLDMRCPYKAEQKVYAAVIQLSPADRVVRRSPRDVPPELRFMLRSILEGSPPPPEPLPPPPPPRRRRRRPRKWGDPLGPEADDPPNDNRTA